MKHNFFTVNAFSDNPFKGNSAAVCFEQLETTKMQSIAALINLSETAFAVPVEGGAAHTFSLRWFTPTVEVDLCGHATLAVSHMIYTQNMVPSSETIKYNTLSGELRVARTPLGLLELDFPAEPLTADFNHMETETAIRAKCIVVKRNMHYAFAEVESEEILRNLNPNLDLVNRLPVGDDTPIRGLMVTAKASSQGLDFVSRFFAPQIGINEDPVTGSTHCCLAVYWSEKLEKKVLEARQISKRGGDLQVECQGARVLIRGKAVTIRMTEMDV